jgi:hypothetical protein
MTLAQANLLVKFSPEMLHQSYLVQAQFHFYQSRYLSSHSTRSIMSVGRNQGHPGTDHAGQLATFSTIEAQPPLPQPQSRSPDILEAQQRRQILFVEKAKNLSIRCA